MKINLRYPLLPTSAFTGRSSSIVALLIPLCLALFLGSTQGAESPPANPDVDFLVKEVAAKGWLVYSSKTSGGDYDLFLARPDGSHVKNLTRSPQFNEFGGRFSPDGKKLLYRRSGKGESINHDLWGAMGSLWIADANGGNPVQYGSDGELPWAAWSPDGTKVACLYKKLGKIRIVELATKKVVKEVPRQGIFQQMFWSADGRQVCGTANLNGQDWNIVSIDLETGKATLLTRNLNCTADWFQKDPKRVIYSHRTPGLATDYGWTTLMQAASDGSSRTLIYAEKGRHIYYGCTSPDDAYAIFSNPESDGGTDANMAIIRLADSPIVVPDNYAELLALYPNAKSGPVLRLPLAGFEPHWTYAAIE
jgi:Tol biopolymer transport system component